MKREMGATIGTLKESRLPDDRKKKAEIDI